jgi:hypothetical protein
LPAFHRAGYLTGEMQPKSSARLLPEYAEHGGDAAFRKIVY